MSSKGGSQNMMVDHLFWYNTSHIIKRTGKMIEIDRKSALSGLKFDSEGAKIWYFRKPGQNCVSGKMRGSQRVLCQTFSERL